MSEVRVKFGADTSGFMTGLDAIRVQSRHFTKEMGGMFMEMAGFAGITTFLHEIAEKFDRIAKLSVQTGISTDSPQILAHNAELSGTSIDFVANAVSRLNRQLAFPEVNDKTANALHALGLSVRELQSSSPEQQLEAIARKMMEMEDAGKRTAVAVALFGKSGREIIPFLESVSNGMQKTSLVSKETIKQIEAFNDSFISIKNSAMAALAPVLAILYQIGRFWGAVLNASVKQFQNNISYATSSVLALAEAGKALVGKGSFKLAADIMKQANADYSANLGQTLQVAFETWVDIGKQSRLALGIDTSEAETTVKKMARELEETSHLQAKLAELETEHSRKKFELEAQITSLKKEQIELQQKLVNAEPDERKKIEDKIVEDQKEIYRLGDQIAEESKRKNEQKQQNVERLQEQLNKKELDSFSSEEKRLILEKELSQLKTPQADYEKELERELKLAEIQSQLKDFDKKQPMLGGVSSLARIGGGGGVGGLENIAQEQLKVQQKIAQGIDKLNSKEALKFS
ncbi:MAG: hypothetical protein V1746_03785 [bacterium]